MLGPSCQQGLSAPFKAFWGPAERALACSCSNEQVSRDDCSIETDHTCGGVSPEHSQPGAPHSHAHAEPSMGRKIALPAAGMPGDVNGQRTLF